MSNRAPERDRQAILCYFVARWGGMHLGAWRDASAPADPSMDFDAIARQVQLAERGKLHALFLADQLALWHRMSIEALSRTALAVRHEPLTLAAALSSVTERIGLLLTASTTYNEPFHVARKFASLDHLSGGRVGWNVVTSASLNEAANFGREEHMDHALRYARGEEFFDVVTGLWDSWDDDAFIRDKASGVYFDPSKLHALDHVGEHLSVAGPLTVARPPQGWPVISQAGQTPVGRRFAARIADVIFTMDTEIERARTFYAETKALVADQGRDPDHAKVLPGLLMVLGRTQDEVDEKMGHLDALVDPRAAIEQLSMALDFDLSGYPLDEQVPELPETRLGSKTMQHHYLELARREGLTLRGLMQARSRGEALAATPETIADHIEEWLTTGAADGFNLDFSDAGASLELFVDRVVPELQRRGLFHTDYSGLTLRENLGVPRPRSRYDRRPSSTAV